MKASDLTKRLRKNRPMTTISLRLPEDILDDLKRTAARLRFSGYQPLVRAYVGQGLRRDLEAPGRGAEDQAVLPDPLEYRLLRGLAKLAIGQEGPEGEMVNLLRRYLDEELSLSKLSHMLGVSRFELQERFERLGVPLRTGPADLQEARDEVKTARNLE